MDINTRIESLKTQFNHSNVLFGENINNIFNELLLVKNRYMEQENNVKQLLEKVEQERSELKEKNLELESYRKVSFIKSMDKQIEEKDRMIELMTKRYKNLEIKYDKLLHSKEPVAVDSKEPVAVDSKEPVAVDSNKLDFKPFYEILEDEKEYYFTKDKNDVGCFYRKLKSGKISKKKKGTWIETVDGLEVMY